MTGGRLPPWVIQIAGLAVIAVALITWVTTGRETSYFIAAGLILTGVGGPIANHFSGAGPSSNQKDEREP